MDRRDFLRFTAGGLALSILPLPACTTSSEPIIERSRGAVAFADDGTRFELAPRQHTLVITSRRGDILRVGGLGSTDGKLNFPAALAVTPDLVYVVDLGNHRVQAFDHRGTFQAVLGAGQLMYPSGIAVRDKRVFVADTAHGTIVELAADGSVARRFGQDALMAPLSLAAIDDNLLVVDVGRRAIVELDDNGSVVRECAGDWVLPYSVATDGDTIYVVDASRPELAVFDRDGSRIATRTLAVAAQYVTFTQNGQLYVA